MYHLVPPKIQHITHILEIIYHKKTKVLPKESNDKITILYSYLEKNKNS